MPDRRTVTVECDYGPTVLWVTPTDSEQRETECKIASVLDGTIPKSPNTGWRPLDHPHDPRGGVGREVSDDLWESLDSWGMEWVEKGGDWAESDADWLRRGRALADAVRGGTRSQIRRGLRLRRRTQPTKQLTSENVPYCRGGGEPNPSGTGDVHRFRLPTVGHPGVRNPYDGYPPYQRAWWTVLRRARRTSLVCRQRHHPLSDLVLTVPFVSQAHLIPKRQYRRCPCGLHTEEMPIS